jgi:hypothetical protein
MGAIASPARTLRQGACLDETRLVQEEAAAERRLYCAEDTDAVPMYTVLKLQQALLVSSRFSTTYMYN